MDNIHIAQKIYTEYDRKIYYKYMDYCERQLNKFLL